MLTFDLKLDINVRYRVELMQIIDSSQITARQ